MTRRLERLYRRTSVVLLVALTPTFVVPLTGRSDVVAQEAPRPSPATTLSPGDLIEIEVWRRPELSGEFTILGSGVIGHPLYRDIVVTDVTFEAVEQRLLNVLRTLDANPQLVVRPLLRVAVGGEVSSPNVYHLPPEATVASAVAEAGGATSRGRRNDVRLIRQGSEERLDLQNPASRAWLLPVRSGDEIVVRRTSDFNFITHVFVPVTSVLAVVLSITRYGNN